MRDIKASIMSTYSVPEEADWPELPDDWGEHESVSTYTMDELELGSWVVSEDGTVLYVIDLIWTEDGWTVVFTVNQAGDVLVWSSDATFYIL